MTREQPRPISQTCQVNDPQAQARAEGAPPVTLTDLLDPVTDAADLDARDFEEMDEADYNDAVWSRESILGLPARPGTVRR